jgi:hypothetical protein
MNWEARRSLLVAIQLSMLLLVWTAPDEAWASRRDEPADVALRYARALASERVVTWAQLDLGCLARERNPRNSLRTLIDEQSAKACWEETVIAHAALLADEPEKGIFGAVGRGSGFGLLHDRHRHADLWRDYPPALFASPAVLRQEGGPVPQIQLVRSGNTLFAGIQLSKNELPAKIRATPVEVKITYPDPLRAPLALRPEEIWWASGAIRRYAPVREVVARFVVVGGLRRYGFPADQAVVNDALPAAPVILGARGGVEREIGRASRRPGDPLQGTALASGLVQESARWWDKQQAAHVFAASFREAQLMPVSAERTRLLNRLLMLDPGDPEVNVLLGNDFYVAFLQEGLRKGGIRAQDEATALRLAELYWNLQAPTWRQELAEVAVGHSPAAESLYGALQSLEIAAQAANTAMETRRRLGALYRWNNNAQEALMIHEKLLEQMTTAGPSLRSPLLSELAWDRVQWIAWDRHYDHPWLVQARGEAQQAVEQAAAPVEKLIAAQALVMIEALSIPRDATRLQRLVRATRQWHDQIPGVENLWAYLIGNDVVKAVVPEGDTVVLPLPLRSPEVLDVGIHARPPKQDLLRAWDFDQEPPGSFPAGFSAGSDPGGSQGSWRVEALPQAPSGPQVLSQPSPCPAPDCFHVILTEERGFEYPDLLVHLRTVAGVLEGGAGLALGAQDSANFYAVTVSERARTVAIHRVSNGRAALLDTAPIERVKEPWHLLRVQAIHTGHIGKFGLVIFFDGNLVREFTDNTSWVSGRVGLVTRGDTTAQFDAFHLLSLVSNQPLSEPAAY